MVRIAGSAAMKRKNCGPTQTVTAKMCSQGVTASDIPSDYTLKPDRLFAFGAHGDEANFHAEHILYEANIRLRLRAGPRTFLCRQFASANPEALYIKAERRRARRGRPASSRSLRHVHGMRSRPCW